MVYQTCSLPAIWVRPTTMLVDYTMVLDQPGVSVKSPTQKGVESVVEVKTMSRYTSDGLSDPSFQILLLRKLCNVV
jgi:hypothetical protein